MVSLFESLESCILSAVCSFLDQRSLGSAEAAAFDRSCVVECWKGLRVAAEQQLMCWPWWWKRLLDQPALPTNHKLALRKMTLQLKSLVRVPEIWTSCICKRSETVIEIQPRPTDSVSTIWGPHHGGTEDYVGPCSAGGWESSPPTVAAVPLSIGGSCTDTFAVGVQLVSKNLGCVGEAFLLGAEFLTVRDQEQAFTICFSPISGRVFIRWHSGAGMVALGLPNFIAAAHATEVAPLEMGGIEAFMFVSPSGGIFFGRRRTASSHKGGMEWCGELPAEFFPQLSPRLPIKQYASLTFQVDKLLETAQISITWAGQLLPVSVPLPRSRHRFDSIWLNYEW